MDIYIKKWYHEAINNKNVICSRIVRENKFSGEKMEYGGDEVWLYVGKRFFLSKNTGHQIR